MSKHEKFILTPITTVLEEMIVATSGIGSGIETYPLWDYILQSTFIKMTGFQEQKTKCIDWELATNGYGYRRSFIRSVNNRGTYSTYEIKEEVYNALLSEIERISGVEKNVLLEKYKKEIIIKPHEMVRNIFNNKNIICYKQRDYEKLIISGRIYQNQYFTIPMGNGKKAKLFESVLSNYYEKNLYHNRNRIAHNTLSYQQNLPDLENLKDEDEYSRNYYFWFAILILIDEIFIELYKKYTECLMKYSYFEG